MESLSPPIPNLIIEECIPSCTECPLIWINEQTGHKIACRCKRCNHGTEQNTQSLAIRIPPRSHQTKPQQIETPNLVPSQDPGGLKD
jgi:hypothetical protein